MKNKHFLYQQGDFDGILFISLLCISTIKSTKINNKKH